jgi:hypothetical protein
MGLADARFRDDRPRYNRSKPEQVTPVQGANPHRISHAKRLLRTR